MRRNKSNHKGEMFDPFTSNNGSKLPEDGSGCNVCVYLLLLDVVDRVHRYMDWTGPRGMWYTGV